MLLKNIFLILWGNTFLKDLPIIFHRKTPIYFNVKDLVVVIMLPFCHVSSIIYFTNIVFFQKQSLKHLINNCFKNIQENLLRKIYGGILFYVKSRLLHL